MYRAPLPGRTVRATVRSTWPAGTRRADGSASYRWRGHGRADPTAAAADLRSRGADPGDACPSLGSGGRHPGTPARVAPPTQHPEVRDTSGHPAADAVHLAGPGRLLRDRGPPVPVADAPSRSAGDHRLGLRVGEPPGFVQLPRLHDRGAARAHGAGGVDQRPGRPARGLPAAPASGGPDPALGEPAGWPGAT